MRVIDINVDCGESFGNWPMGADEDVLPYATSANIACGFHAGDPLTMLRTVGIAIEHNLSVGAHPGFPDLLGFGRRAMRVTPEDCYGYVLYQAGALRSIAKSVGASVSYIKPHGALGDMLRADEALAGAFVRAVEALDGSRMIYYPAPIEPTALGEAAARHGIRVIPEIYPDLEYDDGGGLILQRRKQPMPVDRVEAQVARFLRDGEIESVGGRRLAVHAESICVHSDGPDALEVIRAARKAIAAAGADVSALVAAGRAGEWNVDHQQAGGCCGC